MRAEFPRDDAPERGVTGGGPSASQRQSRPVMLRVQPKVWWWDCAGGPRYLLLTGGLGGLLREGGVAMRADTTRLPLLPAPLMP